MTLKKDWPIATIIPTPKRQTRLPVVLSQDEVRRLLDAVAMHKHRVILTTCYAAGLRISEVIQLTPLAIDSARMPLCVEQGKGRQDRYVMLSPTLLQILREWWRPEPAKHAWLSRHERRRRKGLQGAARAVRADEAGDPALAAPLLRGPPARIGHRRPHHSTAAWASAAQHYSALPALARNTVCGLLGNRHRAEKLARCRRLLGMPLTPTSDGAAPATNAPDYRDRVEALTGVSCASVRCVTRNRWS